MTKTERCTRAPEGWRCTRGPHSDGPCAAIPEIPVGDARIEAIIGPVVEGTIRECTLIRLDKRPWLRRLLYKPWISHYRRMIWIGPIGPIAV